jgi:hypothetical protein
MDVATGRLIWHRPSGEAFGLAGVAGGVVIVQGPDVLRGIDRETGKALWSFQRDGLLEGTLCSDAEVLATARTPLDERLDGLSLLRLDPKTGKAATEQLVRVQRKDEIRCGPLFVNENVVWGFVGEGWRNAERTLVAFTADPSALPVVTAEPVPAEPAPAGPEWRSVEQHTTLLAAIVLPGWRATGAQVGSGAKFGAPLLDEHRGEKNVLMTQASRERAARFTRHYDVPQKDANLVARVGREDDAGWTFRLFADGALFASEPVNKETAPDGWRTVTIDLAPLAGRSVLLTVDQGGPSNDLNRATKAYWKSVTVP